MPRHAVSAEIVLVQFQGWRLLVLSFVLVLQLLFQMLCELRLGLHVQVLASTPLEDRNDFLCSLELGVLVQGAAWSLCAVLGLEFLCSIWFGVLVRSDAWSSCVV